MKMHCRHVDAALSAYRAGDLPDHRARRIEAHLRECAGCRRRLEGLDRATAALERCRPAAPPSGMLQAFHARLAREAAPPRRWRPWQGRPLLAMAVAAAALAVAWWPRAAVRTPDVAVNAPASDSRPTRDRHAPATATATQQKQVAVATAAPASSAASAPVKRAPAATSLRRGAPVGQRRSAPRLANTARERRGGSPAPGITPPAAGAAPQVAAAPAPGIEPAPAPRRDAEPAGGTQPAQVAAAAAVVEIAAGTTEWMDPYTGETRQMVVSRVADTRTGVVHLSLSNSEAEETAAMEGSNG